MFAARKSVEGGGWTLSDAICLMPNGKFAKKSRGGNPPPTPVPTHMPYDHAPWGQKQNMQFLPSFSRIKEDFGPVKQEVLNLQFTFLVPKMHQITLKNIGNAV